jgi:ABC-type lipoprotein export system ATPase subunit
MAEHLVTTDERAPLLLDEVTAQSDATRKRQLLEVLHQISLDRQVILFSHDDDVTEWAAANLDSARDRLVRLDRAAAARSVSGDVALEVVPAAADPMAAARAVPDAART